MKYSKPRVLAIILMLCVIAAFLLFKIRQNQVPKPQITENITVANCIAEVKIEPVKRFNIQKQNNTHLHLKISLKNLGHQTWGLGGVPMDLGAVWFDINKKDTKHNPNYGEQRFNIPAPIGPGEKIKFEIDINLIEGSHQIWLSPVQEGVMWCFHAGDSPEILHVNVF